MEGKGNGMPGRAAAKVPGGRRATARQMPLADQGSYIIPFSSRL
ncbi:UNVERIFIED_ORG: hypothetical protein M2420_000213 [Stenotrophomonas maltophilia]|jgi:hypothetical protein